MKKIFLAPRPPRLKTNQVESDMRGGQALLQQHQLIRPFSAAIANKVINIENADAFCSRGDVCGERRHQHEIFNLFTKKNQQKNALLFFFSSLVYDIWNNGLFPPHSSRRITEAGRRSEA